MKYNARRKANHVPPSKEGHLYYVRLRTPVGLLYKLGFTTMNSVEERLTLKGDGAQLLIDKVIFFRRFKNAWDIEQELHTLLKRKAAFCGWDEEMPLFQNGQSELYCEDVLKLDNEYTYRQAQNTHDEIDIARHISFGADEKLVREGMRKSRENQWDRKLYEAIKEPESKVKPNWILRLIGWLLGAVLLRGVFIVGAALWKLVSKLFETNIS